MSVVLFDWLSRPGPVSILVLQSPVDRHILARHFLRTVARDGGQLHALRINQP